MKKLALAIIIIAIVGIVFWLWPSSNEEFQEEIQEQEAIATQDKKDLEIPQQALVNTEAEEEPDYTIDTTTRLSIACDLDPDKQDCTLKVHEHTYSLARFDGPIYAPDEGAPVIIDTQEYKLAAYDKNPSQTLTDWVNQNAENISNTLETTVETPVLTEEENETENADCDPNEAPCGGVVCENLHYNKESLDIYRCSRWGAQYFLVNKSLDRVIVTENFGSDPPVGPGFFTNYISFN